MANIYSANSVGGSTMQFLRNAYPQALSYYRPSMDICKTGTSTIHGGRTQ